MKPRAITVDEYRGVLRALDLRDLKRELLRKGTRPLRGQTRDDIIVELVNIYKREIGFNN
jgi:hypothetical protein